MSVSIREMDQTLEALNDLGVDFDDSVVLGLLTHQEYMAIWAKMVEVTAQEVDRHNLQLH